MKHYGDITKINGAEIEPVDVITGGSPCQDLSVAGKRAGLAGERSGLFMEQIRIIKEMRKAENDRGIPVHLCRPRYMVWENVPGAFSSNNGRDFAAVLEETVRIVSPEAPDVPVPDRGGWPKSGCIYDEMGRWSVAWRVHDAQFWGVPQRRKRISLVADFGGLSAPEVLFERKGMCWYSAESGETREKTAGDATESVGAAIGFNRERCGAVTSYEAMPTLQAAAGESGNNKPMVCYGISAYESNAMKSSNPKSGIYITETSRTLDLNGGTPACNQGGMAILCLNDQGGSVMDVTHDKTSTLRAQEHGHQPIVVEMTSTKNTVVEDGISPTLTARMGTGGNQVNAICMDVGFFQTEVEKAGALLARQYKDPPITYQETVGAILASGFQKNGTQEAANDMYITGDVVRRLTPNECEALQGFPQNWTALGDWVDTKGKTHKASDTVRYKALGNSIALPFWKVLARRISAQYDRDITMGSLFDGIGGFPYAFEHCGGRAIWASEIEEFPIAVTKRHFPEKE